MDDGKTALRGLKIVDLGWGMAAALIAQHLAASGAEVVRIPPEGGDPFETLYPAYSVWRRGAHIHADASIEEVRRLIADADVCILGGEDHPGLETRLSAEVAATLSPGLVVLSITAYPDELGIDRPGTELLVQAASGLAFEHYSDRPIVMAFNPVTYGAALTGLAGVLAALVERERSHTGQIVRASLFGGALTFGSYLWMDAESPCPESENVIPKDPTPLILAGSDGKFIHMVLGAAGAKAKAFEAFGLDASGIDPAANGLAAAGSPASEFFGPLDLFREQASRYSRDELLKNMWAKGVPADAVLEPGESWTHPQTLRNEIIETCATGAQHVGLPAKLRWTDASGLPRRQEPGEMPLSGIRVLDLGAFVAGPFAAALLADLGAEVIKIEPPAGDPNRIAYRSFAAANRNKSSIVVDMKAEEGRRLIYDLAKTANIVTSNFRNGVSQRLGVDPASLHAVAPDLIILEGPAFGADGPKAMEPGFDAVIQAFCGLEARSGGPGNTPLYSRTTACDYTAGLLGAVSMLIALYQHARTGRGATIISPLYNAGLFLCSDLIKSPDGHFSGQPSLNRAQTGYGPLDALYRCADGWLAISIRGADAAAGLAAELQLTDQLPADHLAWGDTEMDRISQALAALTLADALARLRHAGVWAEACVSDGAKAWLSDDRMIAGGFAWEATHPRFGRIRHIGSQVSFSRSIRRTATAPPELGEHTARIASALQATNVMERV